MDKFNLNKIATSILLASLIILLISNVVDLVYNPHNSDDVKGYQISNVDNSENDKTSKVTEEKLDIPSLIAVANAEKGQIVAKKCTACHTFEKGGANKVGPNLWNIVGSQKAHLGNSFNYSKALLEKGGKWEYEELFAFLKKPSQYIKGTRMAFAGITKPQDIADLIAYIKSLN